MSVDGGVFPSFHKELTSSCVCGKLLSVVVEHLHDRDSDARVSSTQHWAQLCACKEKHKVFSVPRLLEEEQGTKARNLSLRADSIYFATHQTHQ